MSTSFVYSRSGFFRVGDLLRIFDKYDGSVLYTNVSDNRIYLRWRKCWYCCNNPTTVVGLNFTATGDPDKVVVENVYCKFEVYRLPEDEASILRLFAD